VTPPPLAQRIAIGLMHATQIPRPHTDEEMDRLMALPLTGVQNVARALLRYTGLRVSPVCALKIGDVNLSPFNVEGVSLPGSIRASNPSRPYDPLLRRANGAPFTRSGIERWTRSWGEAARVDNCTPHRFRHSLATDLLRRGVPVEVIPRILGTSRLPRRWPILASQTRRRFGRSRCHCARQAARIG
jgi:integrase